jgi:hypothetical protein
LPPEVISSSFSPTEVPPELAEVIEHWDRLPEAVKAGILALVKAASLPPTHRVSDVSDETTRRPREGGGR